MLNPGKYHSIVDQETLASALFQLAKKNKIENFDVVLKDNQFGVNIANEINMTLLWPAIETNNLELCKLLLRLGIDVSLVNSYDESAIDYAKKVNNQTTDYLLNEVNA